MARGVIIFGPAGSGKTTLGKMVAQRLNYPYFDLDDYIWRKDTVVPFTTMYTRTEKAERLMSAISQGEHFVMAGSMSSFHQSFDPLFDLAVHLTADTDTRRRRVHKRELERYGDRILPGGDMYEGHQAFLESCGHYDTDGSPSLKEHMDWAAALPCKVIRLNGDEPLEKNAQQIVSIYNSNRKDVTTENVLSTEKEVITEKML